MLHMIGNAMFVLMMLGFIALVLVELGRSQKQLEDVQAMPVLYRLAVDLHNVNGVGYQRATHCSDSLEELQVFLGGFAMFRIHRACVWSGTKMTHVMNPMGVLEAI